jgi:stage III sporulation protein AE
MLAVLAICVVPVLRIAVQYLALKLTAALGGVLDDGTLAGLVESLASAMGMVLAMTASCALLLLICCVCAMKAVQL